jgi:hypothetical protein
MPAFGLTVQNPTGSGISGGVPSRGVALIGDQP